MFNWGIYSRSGGSFEKGVSGGGLQISIVIPLKCCCLGLSIGDRTGDKVRGNAVNLYYIWLCSGGTHDYISDALYIVAASWLLIYKYNMLENTGL